MLILFRKVKYKYLLGKHLSLSWIYFYFIFCVYVCICVHHGTLVEARGQLCTVISLRPFLHVLRLPVT